MTQMTAILNIQYQFFILQCYQFFLSYNKMQINETYFMQGNLLQFAGNEFKTM